MEHVGVLTWLCMLIGRSVLAGGGWLLILLDHRYRWRPAGLLHHGHCYLPLPQQREVHSSGICLLPVLHHGWVQRERGKHKWILQEWSRLNIHIRANLFITFSSDQIPFAVSLDQVNDIVVGDMRFIQNRAIVFTITLHDPSEYLSDADITFNWDFGDGSGALISRELTVTHTYINTGSFKPKVVVQAVIPDKACDVPVNTTKAPSPPSDGGSNGKAIMIYIILSFRMLALILTDVLGWTIRPTFVCKTRWTGAAITFSKITRFPFVSEKLLQGCLLS